jgi:hypothetical protein
VSHSDRYVTSLLDRIEELEAENERYRKALGIIAIDPGNASPWHVAAQALDGTP